MKVAFVTGSPTKYAIAAQHMTPFGIEPEHIALDLTELQSPIVEDVAVYKAAQAFEILGSPCIVEDSAFGIDFNDPTLTVRHVRNVASAVRRPCVRSGAGLG